MVCRTAKPRLDSRNELAFDRCCRCHSYCRLSNHLHIGVPLLLERRHIDVVEVALVEAHVLYFPFKRLDDAVGEVDALKSRALPKPPGLKTLISISLSPTYPAQQETCHLQPIWAARSPPFSV